MDKKIDVIVYEGGNDIFIYKHPTTNFNHGSQLIVHESQEAVFFRDGKALESFGPGRHTLESQNLPGLTSALQRSVSGGADIFHCEVYFINTTTQLGVKWGTDSKVRMFDPGSGLHIELGACGTFNIKVIDGRKLLIKVVGTTSGFKQQDVFGSVGYSTSSTIGSFKGMIISKIKSLLPKIIRENGIDILEIDEHIDEISEGLRNSINEVLESYGLFMPEFFVTTIVTPDDDPNFRRLKQQFAERTLAVREQKIRQAKAEAEKSAVEAEGEVKVARASYDATAEAEAQKIRAEGEAAAIKSVGTAEAEVERAHGLAHADVLKAQGGNYQAETAREVGTAAASNESSGSSGVGGIASEIVKAGVGIGVGVEVAKTVVSTTKGVIGDAVNPQANAEGWTCAKCGANGITSKFCPECGSPRVVQSATWDCPNCGTKGITSKFCPECGSPRPVQSATWDCPNCGTKGITSKFCPECGYKRG